MDQVLTQASDRQSLNRTQYGHLGRTENEAENLKVLLRVEQIASRTSRDEHIQLCNPSQADLGCADVVRSGDRCDARVAEIDAPKRRVPAGPESMNSMSFPLWMRGVLAAHGQTDTRKSGRFTLRMRS